MLTAKEKALRRQLFSQIYIVLNAAKSLLLIGADVRLPAAQQPASEQRMPSQAC